MGFDADESGRTHSRINETAEQLEGLCMSPSTSNSLTHSVAQNSRGLRLHITHDQSVHDLQSIVATTPSVKLSYTIYGCSSYTNVYRPENILIDETTDQASRWASAANDSDQYIILQLEMPAIACAIRFGKYHTYHVCNLKEFKIYGGMDTENMVEILHHGLQNNNEAELFSLKYNFDGSILPIQYIKIVPLAAYHASFNYSIWFVEVLGIKQEQLVTNALRAYYNYKELQIIRLCLKHFRQRNMMEIFNGIQEQTGVKLEHPLLAQLHRCLVLEGDFQTAEKIIHHAQSRKFFEKYVSTSSYKALWRRLRPHISSDGLPCARGGHQMCLDPDKQHIYLLGGWDGQCDMADFWRYRIEDNQWELLSRDIEKQGGPSARSCHKLCFDPGSRTIYVLGRFVEAWAVSVLKPEADFYRYRVDEDQWERISGNTAQEGGPELIYDHQMCIDSQTATMYVFGGRVVTDNPSHHIYSGLYMYDIKSNTWKLKRGDIDDRRAGYLYMGTRLPSRVGHVMLFDPITRDLLIFGGQRVKDCLYDLHRYSVDLDTVAELWQDYSKPSGPDPGYTQRATMDIDLRELYVFTGYMGSKAICEPRNALWVYNIPRRQWRKVYQSDDIISVKNGKLSMDASDEDKEPCPRFAHQIVYDPQTRLQYIFGGNPGDANDNTRRLDDLWQLKLAKETTQSIVRRCLYLVRAQYLREMCIDIDKRQQAEDGTGVSTEAMAALEYLRAQITPLVDDRSKEESTALTQLASMVCMGGSDDHRAFQSASMEYPYLTVGTGKVFQARTKLFEQLIAYFPKDMREPKECLIDAVKFGQ